MDVSFIRLKSATASRTITHACWNCGEFRGRRSAAVSPSNSGDSTRGAGRRTSVSPIECPGCGCGTRAWNCEIAHGYGVGVVAHVAVLSACIVIHNVWFSKPSRIYLG